MGNCCASEGEKH
jgi:hypothetical protein